MKKYYLTGIGTFLPLTSFANNSSQGDDMKILYIIGIVIFFLIFLLLIWIRIDTKRDAKKSEASKELSKEDKSIVRKVQSENDNLRQKISDKEQEINSLNYTLIEKENEIASLKRQIESISSSFRSSTYLNDSNKDDSNKQEEDNNSEKTDVGDNNKTNSNPLVGKFNFIELAVINGSLVKEESEQTYYRAWRENGHLLFEFVNNDRTRKAINNRTIIVEPFCIKLESSKSPDLSEEIETKTPGILNDDFTLRKKAEIIYK